jgi:hypothetical protein
MNALQRELVRRGRVPESRFSPPPTARPLSKQTRVGHDESTLHAPQAVLPSLLESLRHTVHDVLLHRILVDHLLPRPLSGGNKSKSTSKRTKNTATPQRSDGAPAARALSVRDLMSLRAASRVTRSLVDADLAAPVARLLARSPGYAQCHSSRRPPPDVVSSLVLFRNLHLLQGQGPRVPWCVMEGHVVDDAGGSTGAGGDGAGDDGARPGVASAGGSGVSAGVGASGAGGGGGSDHIDVGINALLVHGDSLYSGSSDGSVRVWDTRTFACKGLIGPSPATLSPRPPGGGEGGEDGERDDCGQGGEGGGDEGEGGGDEEIIYIDGGEGGEWGDDGPMNENEGQELAYDYANLDPIDDQAEGHASLGWQNDIGIGVNFGANVGAAGDEDDDPPVRDDRLSHIVSSLAMCGGMLIVGRLSEDTPLQMYRKVEQNGRQRVGLLSSSSSSSSSPSSSSSSFSSAAAAGEAMSETSHEEPWEQWELVHTVRPGEGAGEGVLTLSIAVGMGRLNNNNTAWNEKGKTGGGGGGTGGGPGAVTAVTRDLVLSGSRCGAAAVWAAEWDPTASTSTASCTHPLVHSARTEEGRSRTEPDGTDGIQGGPTSGIDGNVCVNGPCCVARLVGHDAPVTGKPVVCIVRA